MTGVYHLLRNPEAKQRLVDEVHAAWPVLDGQVPGYEVLEKLPFLESVFIYLIGFALTKNKQTAVVKEALRIAVPTAAGLARVVPPSGATISGVKIPGGVRVSCLSDIRSCLMPLAGCCKPEPPFRIVLRRYLCSTTRVPS